MELTVEYGWIFILSLVSSICTTIALKEGGGMAKLKKPEAHEFCMWETFSAQCGQDEVLLIKEANYGRMRSGRCIKEYGNFGCYKSVLSDLEDLCSGRQQCRTDVRHFLDIARPCPKDLFPYLEVRHSCIKVATGTPEMCHRPDGDNHVKVGSQMGYISTSTTRELGFGTAGCPWYIQVENGRNINFTLLDFNNPNRKLRGDDSEVSENPLPGACPMTMYITDGDTVKTTDICVSDLKEKGLYVTTSSTAQVYFALRDVSKQRYHFLIKYEAVGCSDLEVPARAWYKRDGSTLHVTCNITGEVWYLTCSHGSWIGDVGECNKPVERKQDEESAFPFGEWLILAVIIGIVLGIIVGITLLGVVFLCRKRRYGNHTRDPLCLFSNSRPESEVTDFYGEAAPFTPGGFTKMKPADPRASMLGNVETRQTTIIDYGCKQTLPHTELSGEIPRKLVAHAHLDGSCIRSASFGPTRSHVYESPKVMRGHGNPLDLPPVYHDLESEKEEKTVQFTD